MPTSPQPGPRPARLDRPRAAGLRVLRHLVAHDGPATIAALTAGLGGHPNAVRSQLEGLSEQGFVEVATPAGHGRGRPAQVFSATLAGRQVAGQDESVGDELPLLEAISDHLATTREPLVAARDVGRAWGRRVGSGDVVGLLRGQGFTPEPDDEGLRLLTCPLLEAALRHGGIVCTIHQGLLDATSATPLELIPFGAADACLIRPSSRGAGVKGWSGD